MSVIRWPLEWTVSSLPRHCRILLRSCARHSALNVGKRLHAAILTSGLLNIPHSFLRNAIHHMYAACEAACSARKVFEEIPHLQKDAVDWTTLMRSYVRTKYSFDALCLFIEMGRKSVASDEMTLVCLFNACARLANEIFGAQAQAFMIKLGFSSCTMVCNAVMDMYVKCGLIGDVKKVFDEMGERSVVSWTVLLEGVIKWEGLGNGRAVFDEMIKNEVSWTVMIVSYVENGVSREAFELLDQMVLGSGLKLNYVSLCSLLSASAQSGNVMMGRWVHVYAMKMMGYNMDIKVGTALIDMYAKCGKIDIAFHVFMMMPWRNVVAWNAILSGLAMNGRGNAVLDMFQEMMKEVKPDDMTFTAVLSACSHSGLLDEGRNYFYNLESIYGIRPSVEHYACIVDLLGRAGQLEEAESMIRNMSVPPNEFVLGSLLGACSLHGKLYLGECLMQQLIQMYPLNTEYHILLANMYTLAGKEAKADALRGILHERGITKLPGMSSISVGG